MYRLVSVQWHMVHWYVLMFWRQRIRRRRGRCSGEEEGWRGRKKLHLSFVFYFFIGLNWTIQHRGSLHTGPPSDLCILNCILHTAHFELVQAKWRTSIMHTYGLLFSFKNSGRQQRYCSIEDVHAKEYHFSNCICLSIFVDSF